MGLSSHRHRGQYFLSFFVGRACVNIRLFDALDNKIGSGFSGSICIVSSTYLYPRQEAFKSRMLYSGSSWRKSRRRRDDTLTMNNDRFAALMTPVGVTFMKASKPPYCLASRKLHSSWKRQA